MHMRTHLETDEVIVIVTLTVSKVVHEYKLIVQL
jgi:hypothetical protein